MLFTSFFLANFANMKKPNLEKRKISETLYMTGEYTLDEIADMCGMSRKTISKWSNEDNWAKIRASKCITQQHLIDDLYSMVNNVIVKVNDKIDKIPSVEESTAISKLADAIKKMQEEVGLSEIVGVASKFIAWLRPLDIVKAKEIGALLDAFIKDQVK